MKRIKVIEQTNIEGDLEQMGATTKQARVIGAVVRGVASDIMNERNDKITFRLDGINYNLTLEKE